MRLLHLINPSDVPVGSRQPAEHRLVMESLRRSIAHAADRGVRVTLVDAGTVADARDVSEAIGAHRGDGGHVVFTSMDSGVQPYFHVAIAHALEHIAPALSISGRTIPGPLSDLDTLIRQPGDRHRGQDCLAFQGERLPALDPDLMRDGVSTVPRVHLQDQYLLFQVGEGPVRPAPCGPARRVPWKVRHVLGLGAERRLAAFVARERRALGLPWGPFAPPLHWRSIVRRVLGIDRVCALNRAAHVVRGVVDTLSRAGPARPTWGGAFNGQDLRRQLFLQIVARLGVRRIVETGTFMGTTTAFMRRATGLPVATVESDPRSFGRCAARFWATGGVRVAFGDSRAVLRRWLVRRGPAPTLFYLDAHWAADDLPLAEELALVLAQPGHVVMIDDFAVPGDGGYGFDDYGPGARLDLGLIREPVRRYGASVYFPRASSAEETGKRRGCVVLTSDRRLAERLEGLPDLRPWVVPEPAVAQRRRNSNS